MTKLRRSSRKPKVPRDHGIIDMILSVKYRKQKNELIFLVAWVGMDGEFWVPADGLFGDLSNYDFIDPTTRKEAMEFYEIYTARRHRDFPPRPPHATI